MNLSPKLYSSYNVLETTRHPSTQMIYVHLIISVSCNFRKRLHCFTFVKPLFNDINTFHLGNFHFLSALPVVVKYIIPHNNSTLNVSYLHIHYNSLMFFIVSVKAATERTFLSLDTSTGSYLVLLVVIQGAFLYCIHGGSLANLPWSPLLSLYVFSLFM